MGVLGRSLQWNAGKGEVAACALLVLCVVFVRLEVRADICVRNFDLSIVDLVERLEYIVEVDLLVFF